jgi:hypothetical protein
VLLALLACTAGPTGADSGADTGDSDVPTNPDGLWFDTYAVGWDLAAGFDGEDLRSVTVSGSSEGPLVEITFFEEAWFTAQVDEHRCRWAGDLVTDSADDLGLGDALWFGWSIRLSLRETDCAGFSPVRWGTEDPTAVLEATPLGVGFGPSSESFSTELHDALAASGWSEADWEASFGPFLYSTWFGAPDADGALVGAEINMTRTYGVDDDWALLLDERGESIPLPVEGGLPTGYVRSQSWKLFDARAWFPVQSE